VVGAPAAGTSITITCGDGICNASECAANTVPSCTATSQNYCPADCDRVPPGNVGLNSDYVINRTTTYYTVSGFDWLLPSDTDYAGVRILRSTNTPPTGPTSMAPVATVVAPNHVWNDTTHLSFNTNYYYMFYAYDVAGNYASGVQVRLYVNSGSPPGGGGGGGGIDGGAG
jgi:hypothetical protein